MVPARRELPERPLLRVPVASLRSGEMALDEATSRYVVRVHRLRSGAEFLAFDPEAALEGRARIASDRLPNASILVDDVRPAAVLDGWSISLLQAVGKGDKPEQVVRDATVLGARRVLFVETERCVARAVGDNRRQRERRVAVEAARQAGRGDVPEVGGPDPLEEALGSVDPGSLRLVCAWHPDTVPLLRALAAWHAEQELVLLVGPEGGLTASELELAMERGFTPIGLGPLVLRTETAATVALGVAQSYADAQRLQEDASRLSGGRSSDDLAHG
jgi:16S rRNA (uracil1498-N3)-methyltransferase